MPDFTYEALANTGTKATGTVTAVRMIRSSGSRALDDAVVVWARRMRLQSGAAGTGRLPFDFTLD